jgi:nitronate monooxygenase/enoyl-[acyl-carrier protein] reductase II
VRENRGHDLLPFTGQSAGLVHDIPSAADLVARLIAEAASSLESASAAALDRRS